MLRLKSKLHCVLSAQHRGLSVLALGQHVPPAESPTLMSHQVFNQATPLVHNVFHSDPILVESMKRWAPDQIQPVEEYGSWLGTLESQNLGFEANKNPPQILTHDRFGNRINAASFHPSYHALMESGIKAECPSYYWNRRLRKGSMVTRCTLPYMLNQIDSGVNCPLTMTFAAVPSLEVSAVGKDWIRRVLSTSYDPRDIPVQEKKGATLGMSMTEKQGGSDVRANTTRAEALPNGKYALYGHKWFTSAIMCDAFLTLAYTPKGISCFIVPRWNEDGNRNDGLRVQRGKDKLGDRSNVGTELEYFGAVGDLLGNEGEGLRVIMAMVAHTRLDCVLGSSGTMRAAVSQAYHHCVNRSAFGSKLIQKPLMMNVLADLAVETEASTLLAMRLAWAFEEAERSGGESDLAAFARIAVAVSKYFVCKRTPSVVYEAMECLGGNGYIEDSGMPRLYKQAPLNSIWEGSGNVQCLDIIRCLAKERGTVGAFFTELNESAGQDASLDVFIKSLKKDLETALKNPTSIEPVARIIAEKMALALQASLMLRYGDKEVAKAFIVTRIQRNGWSCFGTIPPSAADIQHIVKRNTPTAL